MKDTHNYRARIDRLRIELGAQGLDGYLVTSLPNLAYLMGLRTLALERFVGVFVPIQGKSVVVVPSLEAGAVPEADGWVELAVWRDGEDPIALLADVVRSRGLDAGRLGVEEADLSLAWVDAIAETLPAAELVRAGSLLTNLRARKSEAEVQSIRRAAAILGDAVDSTLSSLRPGMREMEIRARLTFDLLAAGSEDQIVLVQSGPNTALPHGTSTSRQLECVDLCLVDATAMYEGYSADITRCGSLGQPQPEFRRIWDVLSEAQAAAIDVVRPGVRASDVDRAARVVIESYGFGPAFLHRTGHGIGLEVHEPPFLAEGNDQILELGMVFTVEPGIYFEGKGGLRLEDDVVVTNEAVEVLTHSSCDLRIVECSDGKTA